MSAMSMATPTSAGVFIPAFELSNWAGHEAVFDEPHVNRSTALDLLVPRRGHLKTEMARTKSGKWLWQ